MRRDEILLIGALNIRERVVVPFLRVTWIVGAWDEETRIIFADHLAIFIFDHRDMVLHCLFEHTYCYHRIRKIDNYGEMAWHFQIDLQYEDHFMATKQVNMKIWTKLLSLTRPHTDTYRRVMAWCKQAVSK